MLVRLLLLLLGLGLGLLGLLRLLVDRGRWRWRLGEDDGGRRGKRIVGVLFRTGWKRRSIHCRRGLRGRRRLGELNARRLEFIRIFA